MKVIKYILYTLGLGIASYVFYVFVIVTWPGETTSVTIIDTGGLEPYNIGDSKVDILSKEMQTSFSPQPKPHECPKNWINVKTMISRERSCLLSTNQWEASINRKLCADNEDPHVTMYFSNNKLSRINIRCTLGI